MTGLALQDIEIIIGILSKYPNVEKAMFFGSRAKGNYRPGSDIDIALSGEGTSELIARISGELNDETPLPYTFDVVSLENLENKDLRDHIMRVGIVFFKHNLPDQ